MNALQGEKLIPVAPGTTVCYGLTQLCKLDQALPITREHLQVAWESELRSAHNGYIEPEWLQITACELYVSTCALSPDLNM